MYKVGNDAGKLPRLPVYIGEDAELLLGLPKIFWMCLGVVTSFVFVELIRLAQTY